MDFSELPSNIITSLNDLNANLDIVESKYNQFYDRSLSEEHEKMTPLEKAKSEIVAAHTINSLFFIYLQLNGQDVSKHPINYELNRVSKSIARVKEIEDKRLAPKLDISASKRFVKSALWDKDQQAKKPKLDVEKRP
ncbi:hypothetical protein HELRODRAFT_174618 [Helobdella robusta]|uniref:Nuclear nucleic acid-binding protein C1D n=1 Tax=Helobdella robusta TaxID=6412 RepID=T1F8A9_HELRO|nr:hypothetical protein HELRODRAFT_174618 [Helobdella robusta]ESO01655.1 hypothetical protein HELRODRAFT_174618 [Helobdella robusta]